MFDRHRLPAADDDNFDASIEKSPDAIAVLRRKGLAFDAIVRQIETSVSEDAVDVKPDQFQV